MPRPSKYTREVLAPIVEQVSSVTEVILELGLPVNGGNHRLIAARIRNAELDTEHFKWGAFGRRIATIKRTKLKELVASTGSVAEILRSLGLPEDGRAHRLMSERIRTEAFDTSHFNGRGWSRGLTRQTDARVDRATALRSHPNDVVFIENSRAIMNGPALIRRLVAMGHTYACQGCGISEWCGKRLVLQLDHINGISNDNRLENLRILCPNCHSQTPTFSNRRR